MVAENISNRLPRSKDARHQKSTARENLLNKPKIGTGPRNAQKRSLAREVQRSLIRCLDCVAPKLAAKVALQAWMRVPKRTASASSLRKFQMAKTFTVSIPESTVQCYQWGSCAAAKVLVCHGWEQSAVHSLVMIDRLVQKGFCAVAIDAPGHGKSSGSKSSARRFAEAIRETWRTHGPFHAIVAHSIAASATAMALEDEPLWQPRLVFISAMENPADSIEGYAQYLGLSENGRKALVHEVQIELRRPLEQCGFAWTASSRHAPMLLIHDKKDKVVPYEQTENVLKSFPHAKLTHTSGLGHRRIFSDSEVAQVAANFLASHEQECSTR